MDLFLFFNSGGAFLFFLIVQVVIFRRINTVAIMSWLVRNALFVACFDSVVVLWWCMAHNTIALLTIMILGMSLFIYLSAVFVYANIILGLATTSIRMHVLLLIAQTGEKGILLWQILKSYNRDPIIRIRLARLVASGNILVRGGRYLRNNAVSPFQVYGAVHLFVCGLYGVRRAQTESDVRKRREDRPGNLHHRDADR